MNIVTIQEIDSLRRKGFTQEKQAYVVWNGKTYCTLTLSYKFTILERIQLAVQAVINSIIGNGKSAQEFWIQAYQGKKIEICTFLSEVLFGRLFDDILNVLAGKLDARNLMNSFSRVNKRMNKIGNAIKVKSGYSRPPRNEIKKIQQVGKSTRAPFCFCSFRGVPWPHSPAFCPFRVK